jgi:parallel beta-helix repeat protein
MLENRLVPSITTVQPALASPATVTGNSTALSVLGSDSSGLPITYSWKVTSAPAGAPAVTFSANNATTANSTTAHFGEAGRYSFQVTEADPLGEKAASFVSVTVRQTVTKLSLAPTSTTVARRGSVQLTPTAVDQFGQPIANPSSGWWITGGFGTISGSGLYTAPSRAGTSTVYVRSGGVTASTTITVSSAPQAWYVSSTGSDGAPGTASQPLASIAPIQYWLLPGDQVTYLAGTYYLANNLYVGKSGTAAHPIVIQGQPGATVVLDGSHLAAGQTIVVVDGSYVRVQGFQVQNSPAGGITDWGGSNDVIANNVVRNVQAGGIYVGYSSPGVVTNVLVQGNTVTSAVLANQPRTASGWASAVQANLASNVTFSRNTVYDNYGEGIQVNRSNNVTVTQNVAYDNYSANYYLNNATHTTLSRNLSYATSNTAFFRSGLPAIGILAANETASYPNPLDYDTIVNNVVLGGKYGFVYGSYGSGGGLKDFVIAFNTFYNQVLGALSIAADPGHQSTIIEDNVFDATNGRQLCTFFGGSAGTSQLSFNHNLWYGGSAGPGAGLGDVYADPLFVDPGTNDPAGYRLSVGSPARGAGVAIPGVTTDYFGTTRSGAADLGAAL